MPHNVSLETMASEESFTWREALQSLGIALLLVSSVFVIVSFLLLPVAPV